MENTKQKTMWEKILEANKTICTTNIKGKDYAEVNQRVKAFRMVYPMGSIITQMINNENGVCTIKATITDEKGNVLSTGTAYEKENGSYINKTSYIENCETSAVGRALGLAGFGIDVSIASAEEVQNAINNQNKKEEINPYDFEDENLMTEEQTKIIASLDVELKEHLRKVYKKDPIKLTKVEADNAIKSLKKNGLIKSKKEIEIEKKENEEVF